MVVGSSGGIHPTGTHRHQLRARDPNSTHRVPLLALPIGGLVVGKRELCFQRARDRVPRLSIAVGAGNICAGPSTCGDVDKGYAELNVNESTT